MNCKTAKILLSALACGAMVACNSSDEPDVMYTASDTMISGFNIGANEDLLANLDSVFFSIDQVNARIFNADSLPYGTRINGLIPVITYTSASEVELHIPRKNMSDSIVNYLEHTTDTVDFSNGPVKIRIVSLDKSAERTYTLSVNVHKVKTDTLIWDRAQQSNLPSTFMVPTAQHTTATASDVYCLTSYQGRYCVAKTQNPALSWSLKEVDFSFVPRLETFTGTDNALYIISTDNKLFRSTDGLNWEATSQTMQNIYGNYGTELWGSRQDSGRWMRVSYPTGKVEPIEDNFPVADVSQTINYTFEMSAASQMIMTGGRLASGVVTGDTWGYDGTTWAKLSNKPLPEALANAVVVPYYVEKTNTNRWTVYRESVLIAMFGQKADGTLNDTVYISPDFGMSWKKAGSELQMPKNIPARKNAQGFVYSTSINSETYSRSLMSQWRDMPMKKLPFGSAFVERRQARATKPITEWECPYIYVFGGEDAAGNTYNTLWRGVIRQFTFKPVQ